MFLALLGTLFNRLIFNIIIRNGVYSFRKIVLRIFYIEYFSTFAGDFAPIVLRNAGLVCFAVVIALLGWESCWLVDEN